MRTTRAYIASAGTAAVMLVAALCLFAIVSAFVTFGSWPGAQAHESVNQVLLRDVVAQAKPKKVAVRADAVVVAQRGAQRAARRAARHSGGGVARTPAGTPVAKAPVTGAGPSASGPARSTPSSVGVAPVQQQASDVTKTVNNTTTKITTPVQTQVQAVQNQVNEVVGAITPPAVAPAVAPVTNGATNVTTGVTTGVTNAAGTVLGH
jgi:hypothetical protein